MAACPEPVSDEHIRDLAWPQSAFLAVEAEKRPSCCASADGSGW
jgi:hypothetical protein